MNWIDKMERKFRGRGIPNLTVYVIICYVVGYLLSYMNPSMLSMMSLDVSKILQGQIWRLVTWVIYPPSTGNFFLFVISILFFYYPVGTSLERTWGSFRYTLYIFSGLLFVLIAAFITYFITGGFVVIDGMTYVIGGGVFTTYYVSLSVFLAYAMSYPDMQILLWFVIPIKMKWMAGVYGAIILYNMISYIRVGLWVMAVPILASLLNFVLFFFSTRNMQRYNPKEVHRRREFKKAMAQSRVNPVNGKKIPIYIADYVMMGYGTGAIMAVPAHDQRDYDFAKKFGIDIIEVIKGGDISKEAYTGDGEMINSDFLNGYTKKKDSIERMLEELEKKGIGKAGVQYKMKDWAFNRQRYWGEPIPLIHCPNCGVVAVPEEELPLRLPDVKDFEPGEDGQSPLAKIDSFVNCTCPKCGAAAKRETDTMPQWAGSSWYFLRYTDPHNTQALFFIKRPIRYASESAIVSIRKVFNR